MAAGGGAGVEVRRGVDFGVARGVDGLLDGLRGVVVVLLLVVVLLVLGGGDCGGERRDIGLEMGKLARLRWRGLVDGVCFAGRCVSVVVVCF